MDANKFMAEYKRMCAGYEGCRDCSLCIDNGQCTEIPSHFTKEFIDKVTKTVEDWSAAHPRKTRQSVFLEQYPNAKCVDGIVAFCPRMIDASLSCLICASIDCPDCRRKFWSQEVK